MKLNNIFYVAIAFILMGVKLSFGQNDTKISKQKTLTRGDEIGEIIGTTDDALYFVGANRNSMSGLYHYYISKIDKLSLKDIWDKKFEVDFPNAFVCNNKLMFLSADEKDGKRGDFNEVAQLMTPIESKRIAKNSQEIIQGKQMLNVEHIFSPDSTKLLLMVYLRSRRLLKNPDEMYAKIVDSKTMSLLWEAKLPDNYKDKIIYTYNYKLDNDGNLYYLSSYIENDDRENVKNVLCKLSSKKEEWYYSFEVGNKVLNQFLFKRFNTAGDIGGSTMTRNYNEADYEFIPEGIQVSYFLKNNEKGGKNNCTFFSAKLDQTILKVLTKSQTDFPESIEENLKQIKKKGSAELDYNISKTIRFKNCTYVILRVFALEDYLQYGQGVLIFKLDNSYKLVDSYAFLKPIDRVHLKSYPLYKTGNTYQMAIEMNLRARKKSVLWSSAVFKKISMEVDDNLILFEISENGITKVNSYPIEKGSETSFNENSFTRGNSPFVVQHKTIQYYLKTLDIE